MTGMWQTVVAGLIVMVAAVYGLWALMPAAFRLMLAQRLAAAVRRTGRTRWLVRATAALELAARRNAGGCSECSAVPAEPGRPKRPDKD
jgi:hypothetical protein